MSKLLFTAEVSRFVEINEAMCACYVSLKSETTTKRDLIGKSRDALAELVRATIQRHLDNDTIVLFVREVTALTNETRANQARRAKALADYRREKALMSLS